MSNLLKWLCLSYLLIVALAENYCSLCKDHTMCKFTNKSPACGAHSESGVSPDEAREIVKLHNEYRAKIANGQETRGRPGPQPPAGNMQALVWDDKLAEVAQRWADQCTFQHDQCRDDPRFKVGQNIYWSSGFPTVNWTRAVASWYNEVKDFSAQNASSFKLESTTGHYTQIAWATTTHIGCARTTYGGAYRLQGYRPREFVLAASPSRKVTVNRVVKRQEDPSFFGGATFDSAGEQGAVTGSSGGWSGPSNGDRPMGPTGFFGGATSDPAGAHGAITGSLGGGSRPSNVNRPMRPTEGNFPSQNNGGNDQNSGGFFGGATSDPAGAQGAITGSSGGGSGPMRPTEGNFPSQNNGGNDQDSGGFFGGATTDPAGAQGAITGSSGGESGPMRPTGGNIPSQDNGNDQDDGGFFGGATSDPAGAQGAITSSSGGGSGPMRPTGGNFPSQDNGNDQDDGGFFGGATSDPAGAQGAITGSSGGGSRPSNVNRPMRPIGGNFPSQDNGGNNQDGPGFFGGATSDPAGAQGAITGSSGVGCGPMRPIGGNVPSQDNDGNNQDGPGFFGGATSDPAGAQGAITGSSGVSGPTNGNRPMKPTGGYFPSNGNHPNNPVYPNFPNITIEDYPPRPSHPSVSGNSVENDPSIPIIPNFPDITIEDYPIRPNYPSYPDTNDLRYSSYPNYPSRLNGHNYPTYQNVPQNYLEDYPNNNNAHFLQPIKQIYKPAGSVSVDNEDLSRKWFSINALVKTSYSFLGRDQILICNYGPAGNWRGEPLYTVGNACSQCPSGTTCNGGLCVAD